MYLHVHVLQEQSGHGPAALPAVRPRARGARPSAMAEPPAPGPPAPASAPFGARPAPRSPPRLHTSDAPIAWTTPTPAAPSHPGRTTLTPPLGLCALPGRPHFAPASILLTGNPPGVGRLGLGACNRLRVDAEGQRKLHVHTPLHRVPHPNASCHSGVSCIQ